MLEIKVSHVEVCLLWHEGLLLGLNDQIKTLSTLVYAGEEILNGTKWDGWHLNNYQYQGQFCLSSVAPALYAAGSDCFVLMTRCCCFRPSPKQLLEPTLKAIIFALTESKLIETGAAY